MSQTDNHPEDILTNDPLVSVGIPTYNRPDGLRRTLGCITGQTYRNLEIIISDNCSPGPETMAVVHEFTSKDSRIQYYRQETNQGPSFNFQFVLDKSNGKYFMWASDDDEWDSTFISKCVTVLERNPDVILCATRTLLLDSNRTEVGIYDENVDTFGLPKLARIKKVILGINRNTTFHGIRRAEITKKIGTSDRYGYDHVYMMQLSFYGSFVILPEVLLKCHIGGIGSSPDRLVRCLMSQPRLIKISPSLYIMKTYLEEISKSGLSNKEKIYSGLYVVQRYVSPPYVFNIIRDFATLPLRAFGLAPLYRKK